MSARRYRVKVNGQVFEVEVEEVADRAPAPGAPVGAGAPAAAPRAEAREAPAAAPAPPAAPTGARTRAAAETPAGGEPVRAPLPGLVLEVRVAPGQRVRAGDLLVILEAMKMENEISAPRDGTVRDVPVQAGQAVDQGDVLVVLA